MSGDFGFNKSGWFGDLVSYSPDRRYAVRFYDAFQFNPPQSTTIGVMYRWEIVEDMDMMVQHQFADKELKEFPSLFEDIINGDLKNCHPYVMLTEEERASKDVEALRNRFWYWSDDSRFFTIMLLIEGMIENKVVTFDMERGTYRSTIVDHLPQPDELKEIGRCHITVLTDESSVNEPTTKNDADCSIEQEDESRDSSTDSGLGKGPGSVDGVDAAKRASIRDMLIFWIGYPAVIFIVCWAVTYYFIGEKGDTATLKWSSVRWSVSLGFASIMTLIGILTEVVKHRKQRRKLREYLAMGHVFGRSITEFERILGDPSSYTNCYFTDRENAPGHIAVWSGYRYQVVICFDEHHRCVGIKSEVLPPL